MSTNTRIWAQTEAYEAQTEAYEAQTEAYERISGLCLQPRVLFGLERHAGRNSRLWS